MTKRKNPDAVRLGRLGGLASRKNLSDEEKKRLAQKAANERWARRKAGK